MFVIELIYKATLAEIDAMMKAHVVFLKKYYAAGNFLVSGRMIPRDGGIIVAVGKNREQIEAIVREDPFVQRGLGLSHHPISGEPEGRRYSKTDNGVIPTPCLVALAKTRLIAAPSPAGIALPTR